MLERDYYDKGRNRAWNTPHSAEYWSRYLELGRVDGPGLEVGCGPNGVYRFVPEVTGVDPIKYRDAPNFRQATGETLPYEDDAFNYVILCNALDHTCSPVKVLSEAARVAPKLILLSYVFPLGVAWAINAVDPVHPHHFSDEQLNCLVSRLYAPPHYRRETTFNDWPFSVVYDWGARAKLSLAHLLGVRVVLIHAVRKDVLV